MTSRKGAVHGVFPPGIVPRDAQAHIAKFLLAAQNAKYKTGLLHPETSGSSVLATAPTQVLE